MKLTNTRKRFYELRDWKAKKDFQEIIENIREIKRAIWLTDTSIKRLLNEWYTFTEILSWSFNEWFSLSEFIAWEFKDNTSFKPKNIIMEKTKDYLLNNNEQNTYAHQW